MKSAVRIVILGALAVAALSAAGCSSFKYYMQAMNGQMELARKARPLADVLADPRTDPQLQAKLTSVQRLRDFASRELALPDNGSYRQYADLERPFVVWNVFATEEFSLTPKEWCFPFAGCVGYKGYFGKAGAENLASELRKEDYDVFVGGVPAYSTLGWLNDPLLNTFIRYPETEIARLIFHELAHQVVYVKGDSTFNESFAVAVEQAGIERWLSEHGSEQQRAAFELAQIRRSGFLGLIANYRQRLEALYDQPLDAPRMRARKQQVFAQMRAEYAALKQGWDGFSGYDWWFEQSLNNAQLASIGIYTEFVPGFQRLLLECKDDLPCFYQRVGQLAKLSEAQRRASLQRNTREASAADAES